MSTVISKLLVTGGRWVDGEILHAYVQALSVFVFFYLTSEKLFRNKTIHDQITQPKTLINDALCSGS